MDATQNRYQETIMRTRDDLGTMAKSRMLMELSQLALPEVDEMVERVSQVIPAGNVPGMILSGLARLPGRKLPDKVVKRDVNLLFKGIETTLDKAVYGAFFAGPAAVIWGYQNILRLAGKDPDDAFPEGVWQFYVDYALREDTARHANETDGFDNILNHHGIRPTQLDRMTAWVMATIHSLHQYKAMLENEWRERTYIHTLEQLIQNEPEAKQFHRLFRQWEVQRPYRLGMGARRGENFPEYRRTAFDRFIQQVLQKVRLEVREKWVQQILLLESADLVAYQRQMSILAYLEPGKYGETRQPLPLNLVHVGLIWNSRYYLISACQSGTDQPADATVVRSQIAAILDGTPETPPTQLTALARVRRSALYNLRHNLNPTLQEGLEALRLAPILLNFDARPRQLPLAEIRQAERGVGDHSLTIFDTGRSFIFDQSHIFFDGAWGAAFAEILTNEALSWAVYLSGLPPAQVAETHPYAPVLPIEPAEQQFIAQSPQVTPEASAESAAINVKSILALRRLFKKRSDLLELTVNDILLLYRAIHLLTYQPSAALWEDLQDLRRHVRTQSAATAAMEALANTQDINPAILIPVDASQQHPRDRVFPLTFEVPLHELDLLALHRRVKAALDEYGQATSNRQLYYDNFEEARRAYMSNLAAFGKVLSRAKDIAALGGSTSVEVIKLLAHMPTSLQRFLDKIPGRFDVLNDIIKGREVFSNVGVVAPTSTLNRFITAKDDNEKKTLAWGVLTDADGVMHLSLRDFRPHVALLSAVGQAEIANKIAQDYLDAYVDGLNTFIRDLRSVIMARPMTRPAFTRPTTMEISDPLMGIQLEHFRIDSPIMYGEHTHVYAGTDLHRETQVAIKVLEMASVEQATARRDQLLQLVGWRHPHVASVYHADTQDELCYVIMNYLHGPTLAEEITRYVTTGNFMPAKQVLQIARGIAQALDAAHARGFIHGNLKPANIMLSEQSIVVTDFGMTDGRPVLENTHQLLHYVAPEQTEPDKAITPASDLYALGVILYEMLTGIVPFDHPQAKVLAFHHQSFAAPNPLDINPHLNTDTADILMKALKKSPGRRFTSAQGMVDELEQALSQQVEDVRFIELPPVPAGAYTSSSSPAPRLSVVELAGTQPPAPRKIETGLLRLLKRTGLSGE